MSTRVTAVIHISSNNTKLVNSLFRSLKPDNTSLPHDMRLTEEFSTDQGGLKYTIRLEVEGDAIHCIKRAGATINEILSILKTVTRTLESLEEPGEV